MNRSTHSTRRTAQQLKLAQLEKMCADIHREFFPDWHIELFLEPDDDEISINRHLIAPKFWSK
jgi:hypothetical protein